MAQVRTEAEMFPLVESWQKSGLTQKEFSQQQGISDQVFYYWVARYRKAQPVSSLPAVSWLLKPSLFRLPRRPLPLSVCLPR
jgi:hypothetical protein